MTTTPLASHVLISTLEEISIADDLETVTAALAHAARSLMNADGATVVLREDGRCFYADEDAIGPLWKGQRFPMSACISGWAMLNRENAVIDDIYADDRIPHDAYRPTFVRSLCMVPIRAASPIGALGAYWSRHHRPTPGQIRQLEVIASSAAVALENLELRGTVARRESERDDLQVAIHSLAHDLRNPVVAMLGYAELIADDPDTTPEEAGDYARTIMSLGQRLSSQMDRMLALYRVVDRELVPEVVDLTATARELAEQLEWQAPDRVLRIEVEDGLTVWADPVLLRLTVENLLSNAVKFTAGTPEALIEVARAHGPDRWTCFVVRDNGAGFDPEQAGRLFKPLGRLHTDQEFPGTGFGLASVARIVERHQGQVWAEGAPGAGAAFFVALPVAG